MKEQEEYTLAQLFMKISELEKRIAQLEEGVPSKGYYLEGVPEYIKKYAKELNLVGGIDE